jgi:hypothetical protein
MILAGSASSLHAASVILKIRAVNPSPTNAQNVEIKSYLPPRAAAPNIINLGDMEVGYDVQEGLSYVHRNVELGPGEVRTFDVEIEDIWVIPEKAIADLKTHAAALVEMLRKSAVLKEAQELDGKVEKNLNLVTEDQDRNSLRLVKAEDHIRAYEINLSRLERAKEDVAMLENLVIGTGADPGRLLGAVKGGMISESVESGSTNAGVVTIRIQVHNPSPVGSRTVTEKRYLPPEIRAEDVLDAGGLKVGQAPDTKLAFVYLDGLELGPQETRVVEVRVRDKWRIPPAQLDSLEARATNVLTVAIRSGRFKSVETAIQDIRRELGELRQASAAGAISPDYVAQYRDRLKRLGLIERKVVRLEELLKSAEPTTFVDTLGKFFATRAPDKRTTWILIYSILGFLGVMSLLFFLRWYGRSKGEKEGTE